VSNVILGFDNWTAGAHFFERLVPALESLGYRLILVHVGSWGHDKGRPLEEEIGPLTVRDISYYKGMSFDQVIIAEKPAGVLMLDTNSLPHLSFNLHALHLGVPTCHLYHGLVTVQAVGAEQKVYKVNFLSTLSMLKRGLYMNLFRRIPVYFRALYKTGAPFSCWKRFGQGLLAKLQNRDETVASFCGTQTSIGCVYTASDIEHMNTKFQMPLDRINVVGNPDLMNFGLAAGDFGLMLTSCSGYSKVFYIDTAMVNAGICFSTRDEFVQHLVGTDSELKKIGLDLVVKLHPSHNKTDVPDRLRACGIELADGADFVTGLKCARAAIVESSTASLIPALLGLPVFLAQYGKLEGQHYGRVLTSYPRSKGLKDTREFKAMLEHGAGELNPSDVMAWIESNAGPMPADDMPDRVASAIHGMVSSSTISTKGYAA